VTCGLATVHLNGHIAHLHTVKRYTMICHFSLIGRLDVPFARLSIRLSRIMTRQQMTNYLQFSVYDNTGSG
jgi:hypothetical protein